MTKTIVVASGKGGTGKTSVTAGAGCALAKLGFKCLLVDADAGMQSLDMALGVCEDAVFDFSDVVKGNVSLEDAAVPVEDFPGAFVLAAPSNLDRIEGNTLRTLVHEAKNKYDFVLIDAPAGIGRGFVSAARAANSALVVATPDPICLRSAEKCARRLEEEGVGKTTIVVNRVRRDFIRHGLPNLDDMIDGSATRLLGYVPEDDKITYCGAEGKSILLYPKKKASRAFMNIAKRISGEHVPLL